MATYDDTFSARPFTLRLTVNATSQNIAANTSVVAWSLRIIRTGSSDAWSSSGNTYNVKINGTTVGSGSWTFDFRGTSVGDYEIIDSGTRTITHDDDGTKSIPVSSSATATVIGSAARTGTYNIATIPRASTPTFEISSVPVTSAPAGSSLTIQTNRASSSFTHNISYAFGTSSGTIGSGVGASTTWTPPLSLLNEIPNSTSGAVSIITDTYSGATLVGTKTVSLTLTVPVSGGPDFGTITHSEATTTPVNIATVVGGYVKDKSKLNVAITSPVGYYGSTVVSYKIEIADQVINAASGVTGVITQTGTLALKGTITDSRGMVHTETVNVTVLNYTPPNISVGTAVRANSGGTVTPTGTYIRTDLTAAVQSLVVGSQKNELKYRIRIKQTTDATAWASVTPAASSAGVGSTGFASSVTVGTYSIANSYLVRIEVEDKLGTVSAVEIVVGTGGVQVHFSKTDDGIGVGKYWGQGSIDAAAQIYQRNGKRVLDVDDLVAATPDASTTVKGKVELATLAETNTGTDPDRAVTPAGLATILSDNAISVAERPVRTFFGAPTPVTSVIIPLTGANEYEITVRSLAATAGNLRVRLRNSGTTDSSASYYANQTYSSTTSTPGAMEQTGATFWALTANDVARQEKKFVMNLYELNAAAITEFIATGGSSQSSASYNPNSIVAAGKHLTASAYDSIELVFSTAATGSVVVKKIIYY